MKSKLRWRHYCDYCSKSGGQRPTMEKHEAHCTLNPERGCRMCEAAGLEQQPVADLIEALGDGDEEGMKVLCGKAQGCPACMLAAIRQSGLRYRDVTFTDAEGTFLAFDFRREAEGFWIRRNEEAVRSWMK